MRYAELPQSLVKNVKVEKSSTLAADDSSCTEQRSGLLIPEMSLLNLVQTLLAEGIAVYF